MDELKRILAVQLGIDDINKLPLTLPVPVAGKLAGLNRGGSYRAAKAGDMPCIDVARRKHVLTIPWLKILAGEVTKAA